MDWMYFLGIVVLVASIIGLAFLKGLLPSQKIVLPYRMLAALLTPAERSFFGVLQLSTKGRLLIFAKVRVADILTTTKGLSNSERQSAFNRIKAKHFDFVLCDPNHLGVVCVLELDDKSHKKASRQQRDEFLNSACEAAGVPLIHFQAKAAYAQSEIEKTLGPYLPQLEKVAITLNPESEKAATIEKHEAEQVDDDTNTQPSKATAASEVEPIKPQSCPKCHSELVKRVAKKGKNAGKKFMACSSYPKCRFVLSA